MHVGSVINDESKPNGFEGRSMRQGILLALVLSLAAIAFASPAAADPEGSSCPNGFTAYSVPDTEAELLRFPRIADGLAADPEPYTAQQLIDQGGQIDANGDGIFCLKAISNLRGSSFKNWGYFYGARDNDTAAA